MTLVAWISPLLSRLPSVLSPMMLRASTASPSRSTVAARKFGHAMVRQFGSRCARRRFPDPSTVGSPAKSRGNSSSAPASTCVSLEQAGQGQRRPSHGMSGALASSNASRQSLAAARPIFGDSSPSSAPRAARETCVWPRRCVIVAGSGFGQHVVVVGECVGQGRSVTVSSPRSGLFAAGGWNRETPWTDRGRRPVATGRCE